MNCNCSALPDNDRVCLNKKALKKKWIIEFMEEGKGDLQLPIGKCKCTFLASSPIPCRQEQSAQAHVTYGLQHVGRRVEEKMAAVTQFSICIA